MTASSLSANHENDASSRLLAMVHQLARELRSGEAIDHGLGLDHSLERDYGLDSLTRVELVARIEREFGVLLTEEAFAEAETPRDLLTRIESAAGGQAMARQEAAIEESAGNGPELPPAAIATLTDLLDWRATRQGDQVHITFYDDEAAGCRDLTYRMLQDDARSLAAGLLEHGCAKGDRIAIMLPTGREFFAAFHGALHAGCIPTPLYPPARPSQLEEHLRRISGIVENSGATIFITDDRAKLLGHLLRVQNAGLRGVATVADLSLAGASSPLPRATASDIAFLQYTSGSTGNPKGVILTHANLLANITAMQRASGMTADDVFVSWLPLYHDMGLIGACLGSLFVGFRLILMSPLAFLSRPARWLAAIHRYRGTASAAPNFAYELCAGKINDSDLDGIDLSSWRLAYNGAEPVNPATLENFARRFARHGFQAAALMPVYGLAESSVGLAFPPPGRGPLIDRIDRATLADSGLAQRADLGDAKPRLVVSCGRPLPGHEIRIVDHSGRPLPERTQGRVQFKGPSSTSGYFKNPGATARLISGDWRNSGDLGYLAAGEIHITGREKDIIIRGGHNIHPQELEEAAGRVAGVRRGGVAVFPAADANSGSERLVVLAETREKKPEERQRMVAEINRLAVDLIGLPADDVVLALPGAVKKTSSGKIRRAACREHYEQGDLAPAKPRPLWRQALGAGLHGLAIAKEAAGWAWSAWAWTVFAAIAPVVWLLVVIAPNFRLGRAIARAGARLALWLAGLAPLVKGSENLGMAGPLIVAVNHASYLDAIILAAALPPRFAFVAKQELLQSPLAALPLRRLGTAFVERFDSARGVEDTRALEARTRVGESLVFFPEGTFRREPGLLPFRMGAFLVAARADTPVLPVVITGSRDLLPGESRWPRYSRLAVLIGQPLTPQGGEWQDAIWLRDHARRFIAANLGEIDTTA